MAGKVLKGIQADDAFKFRFHRAKLCDVSHSGLQVVKLLCAGLPFENRETGSGKIAGQNLHAGKSSGQFQGVKTNAGSGIIKAKAFLEFEGMQQQTSLRANPVMATMRLDEISIARRLGITQAYFFMLQGRQVVLYAVPERDVNGTC